MCYSLSNFYENTRGLNQSEIVVENGSINWSISYYLLNTYNVPDSTVMNYSPFSEALKYNTVNYSGYVDTYNIK